MQHFQARGIITRRLEVELLSNEEVCKVKCLESRDSCLSRSCWSRRLVKPASEYFRKDQMKRAEGCDALATDDEKVGDLEEVLLSQRQVEQE